MACNRFHPSLFFLLLGWRLTDTDSTPPLYSGLFRKPDFRIFLRAVRAALALVRGSASWRWVGTHFISVTRRCFRLFNFVGPLSTYLVDFNG